MTRYQLSLVCPEYARREEHYQPKSASASSVHPEHYARKRGLYNVTEDSAYVDPGEGEYDLYCQGFPDTW